ncbi:hypothetical protein [Candidatus Lokiarchaeum ossiferum]|uniref:hypothetical protein n=1 Tax=Candidatus Lokiarchaeum ossiferum TaxID=2951803 RepID=UPI00352C9B9C
MTENNTLPEQIELTGKRLAVYQFLLENRTKSWGIREIYRKLGLSNVSLADYHVKKLIEFELVKIVDGNKYTVNKLLSVGYYENHVLIGDKFIPKNLFFLSFVISFLISAIFLIFAANVEILIFSFFFFTFVVMLKEITPFIKRRDK